MKLSIIYVRVGTTRSGKMIPYSSSIDNVPSIIRYFKEANFSSDDLLDAFAVFNYLALRTMRRGDKESLFERHSQGVQDSIEPEEFQDAKKQVNIKSAFDLRNLGKSLVSIEFADF